jgi:hypothetical protein
MASASEELDRAIQLYQEARYEDALGVLDALSKDGGAPEPERRAVMEYSALCLLALGRSADAERLVENLLAKQPQYRPSSKDLSPRLTTLIVSVRNRQLPSLVRERYRAGRASFDRKAAGEAERHFRAVISLLDHPDVEAGVRDSLSDVRELASGFLAIIENAKAVALVAPLPDVKGPVSTPPPAPAAPPPSFFGSEDRDVVPPAVLRQDIPGWLPAFGPLPSGPRYGVLEVMVGVNGRVERATLTRAAHPRYDQLLLTAARNWKYHPATRDGNPVRYRKVIQVTLVDRSAR